VTNPVSFMIDETEDYRRARLAELNANTEARKALEERYGQVWSTDQLREDFIVLAFAAPFIMVREKATGKKGSLEFQHMPRFYWGWQED